MLNTRVLFTLTDPKFRKRIVFGYDKVNLEITTMTGFVLDLCSNNKLN